MVEVSQVPLPPTEVVPLGFHHWMAAPALSAKSEKTRLRRGKVNLEGFRALCFIIIFFLDHGHCLQRLKLDGCNLSVKLVRL